jgi:hypothetical protein
MVHHGLEGRQGVREAEEHDHRLKQSLVRLECGLPLVAIVDSDVIIPPADIELRKECRSTTVHSREPIHEFANEGERGGVSNGERIQFSVVLDGSEIAILLFDEEEGEGVLGFRLSDIAFWKVLVDELLKRDVFSR